MIEWLCEGINAFNWCFKVDGIKLDASKIVLPEAYKGWVKEKAVYDPKEDKIYVQVSFQNLREVIVL